MKIINILHQEYEKNFHAPGVKLACDGSVREQVGYKDGYVL